jgi:sortase (surface protein transpeptidase)
MTWLDSQVDRVGLVAQSTSREGQRSYSVVQPRGVTRNVLARLVLALTMLLGMVTTLSKEATAQPGQANHTLSGVDSSDDESHRAPPPVSIQIDAVGVNGPVETREIVDGELETPSGPWVVAWYRQTARPGELGNVVMGGHVDYWNIGPAVFFNLGTLEEGEEIEVTDAAGNAYDYAVEWIRAYPVAELTPGQLREIVGPTEDPSLTLITCGGAFDPGRGEYLMRMVVRAARVER